MLTRDDFFGKFVCENTAIPRITSDGVGYNGGPLSTRLIGITVKMHAYGKFEHFGCYTHYEWKVQKSRGFGKELNDKFEYYYFWAIPINRPRRLDEKPYIDNDIWSNFINDLFFSRKAVDLIDAYRFLDRVFNWTPKPLFVSV